MRSFNLVGTEASLVTTYPTTDSRLVGWRQDITAGAIASIVTLPVCVASGVLAFAPLGPSYAAMGAAAGLSGAIVAGAVSALVATSSFITTSPRVSESLLLASLIIVLSSKSAVANDKWLIVIAVFLCVALGGIWQVVFGIAGVAKIIKFAPHPVLVGFLNGVAVLVALSQLKPYFSINPVTTNLTLIDRPLMFVLMLGVASLVLFFPTLARKLPSSWLVGKVPALPVGFVGGIGAFYFIKALNSGFDLGPTIGRVNFALPLLGLRSTEVWKLVAPVAWEILPVSFVLAIVATMDTLLAFRTAQNISDLPASPVRDLVAQGIGNCASAIAGGVTGAASPSPIMAAYRAGGRTRLAPLSSAMVLLVLSILFPHYLAAIPFVVLSGILLAVAILLFDRWTVQIVSEVHRAAATVDRRRSIYDLSVVVIVMGVTVLYSVVAGVITGCLLSGIVFVVNMSRPIVRRIFAGNEIQSKRVRPTRDVAILRDTGSRRAVLQLEGVLFFGNADDLSAKVKTLFQQTDMVTLDMRGVSDIDVSGANILANLISKSREVKKSLLFCEVPPAQLVNIKGLFRKAFEADELIKPDLDSALEWMEEKSLLLHADKRSQADVLAFSEIDFLAGMQQIDLDRLSEVLTRREFAPGEIICHEGDEGDRMWLLAKGSVSVRLKLANGRESVRIASLARGTTIGEMSLIESAPRSASIVADEQVVCYELLRDGFTKMLADYPTIATKLLSNLARELSRRLRRTSEDLRNRS
jgi:MFS superfamily sulfate permease-like transporter